MVFGLLLVVTRPAAGPVHQHFSRHEGVGLRARSRLHARGPVNDCIVQRCLGLVENEVLQLTDAGRQGGRA